MIDDCDDELAAIDEEDVGSGSSPSLPSSTGVLQADSVRTQRMVDASKRFVIIGWRVDAQCRRFSFVRLTERQSLRIAAGTARIEPL